MSALPCHWDCETYSEVPIKSAGMFKYAEHSSTEMISCAYAVGDSAPILWLPGEAPPPFVQEPERYQLWCYNALFEYVIWQHVMLEDWGEPPDIEHWTCVAAMASAMALPRTLGAACEAIGLPTDKQKDKRGVYLIRRLCKPNRGKRIRDEDLIKELYLYNKQDVIAERALSEQLRPLNNTERKVWELDQRVNLRGVYVDTKSVDDALALIDKATESLNEEVVKLTEGELIKVSQRDRVLDYFYDVHGYSLSKYDKASLASALEDETLPHTVRRLIEIRLKTGKTSTAKYVALKKRVTSDRRAHGLVIYHGAGTGRWTSVGFQNLPKPSFKNTDACIDLFHYRDSEFLTAIFNDSMQALSSCLRGMICAPEGKRLIVADYLAIEARVLAWLAGQKDVLDIFRSHGKLYEHTASRLFGLPLANISEKARFIGKVATLALGYQGGVKAFQKMADSYNVKLSAALVETVKNNWRKANKNIVRFWGYVETAANEAVQHPSKTFNVRSIKFRLIDDFLLCRLPSGRALAYYQPRIAIGNFGKKQVTYMGTNSVTRKWERQQTYGGRLVENITQAVARDLLAEALLRVEAAGYEVVLSVHDEIVAEVNNGFGSVEEFEQLMCVLPHWAKDLPIKSEGFECQRYRK